VFFSCLAWLCLFGFFFFSAPVIAVLYTLSLHDALPISAGDGLGDLDGVLVRLGPAQGEEELLDVTREELGELVPESCSAQARRADRKSTRLNSSHEWISYAVFCLKKKKKKQSKTTQTHR